MSTPNPLFWKRKLAAFLHDPPSKFADLGGHEQHARTLYRQAGFVDETEVQQLSDAYTKESDWTASSADRLPFPKPRGNYQSAFDGQKAGFHHPLSPGGKLHFHRAFQSAEAAMEVDQIVQPILTDSARRSEGDEWQARYLVHWRLWEKFATEKDYRFAFLPADTRIPDHTVWMHMQMVSALDGCANGTGKDAILKPAFLKFQLGPVQDFIAEARSVRDLWSGSYLLSWLMAAGLKALALRAGPDAVIFPNLKDQPLFDLHLRDDYWSKTIVNGKSVWDHLDYADNDLRTPNLPNVFLAVVHQDHAAALGQAVADAISAEWLEIGKHVWEYCEKAGMIPDEEANFLKAARKTRFDAQLKHHLTPTWQVTPWPESLDAALALAKNFAEGTPVAEAKKRVQVVVDYFTKTMPEADRDTRYYIDGKHDPKSELNNIGIGWSIVLAFNSWQLDAVRQNRAFDAWDSGGWKTGVFGNKDSLGGKAEAVAGGKTWKEAAQNKGGVWEQLFKHDDWVGAATLIKRLWHIAHLKDVWMLPTGHDKFFMPNTRGIAKHEPYSSGDDEDEERFNDEKYFAVLALDGDQIGKWVSGEKTPSIGDQVSHYDDALTQQKQGVRPYFTCHSGDELLAARRPLSPAYHLQFSQALSNFALRCARQIVEAFAGRLIFAGGDDVMAMLPANTALECGQALREAFQGRTVASANLYQTAPGFLNEGHKDQQGHDLTFIVPGHEAEVSVGIAIAHFKLPLQDVIRAARSAEKRAKNQLDRAAVAVSLFKRSGEITEWGCQWESGGLALYEAIAKGLDSGLLSAKFPYRVCQLLESYLTHRTGISKQSDAGGFDASEVIRREFTFAAERQGSKDFALTLAAPLNDYLGKLAAACNGQEEKRTKEGKEPATASLNQILLTSVIGLCTTVAFAHRTKPEDLTNPPKGH